MVIDWDVAIPMDDGLELRADVFRPDEGEHPVILSHGPYGKGLAFQEGYPDQWEIMVREHPEVARGTSNRFQNWEVVDPERWVPDGYTCVRVDSRGTGRSPGRLDPFSPRETRDLYECVEWAGTAPWSSGRIGLAGISYYAINQWHVAALQPPHLAAICPWEGAADWYRDMTHHGGIVSTFWANWFDKQVLGVQHGFGDRGAVNPNTGELVAGPETLSENELAASRCDLGGEILDHPLADAYHRERSPDWSKVTVPLLSAANWGGQGLHARGNFEGFVRAASRDKWLEVHGLEHWTEFYTDYGVDLQKRFFARFLKGEGVGWRDQPRVQLQVRRLDGFEQRAEREWPLARTRWMRLHLDPAGMVLRPEPVAGEGSVAYEAAGDGVTFATAPLEAETEITGPSSAKLFLSSSTDAADLFLVLRVVDPGGEEVVFQGALDPHTPVAQGWLRASHRRLDLELSTEYGPYHAHKVAEALEPGRVYELDVELWPTCVVVPAGHRIALTVRGRDYEHAGGGAHLGSFKNEMRGCGPFLHDDPRDRPAGLCESKQTLHFGPDTPTALLLPEIPKA
ncbi:MAG: CocE/NonD family hydrolase [Actinomycetota bacterium]|nr:CocE/NonD family hydrolase [Actinomycetota bacterium]